MGTCVSGVGRTEFGDEVVSRIGVGFSSVGKAEFGDAVRVRAMPPTKRLQHHITGVRQKLRAPRQEAIGSLLAQVGNIGVARRVRAGVLGTP